MVTITPDGGDRQVVGPAGICWDSDRVGPAIVWSPDSRRLAFIGYQPRDDKGWGVYTVNLSDGQFRRLPVQGLRGDLLAWQPVP